MKKLDLYIIKKFLGTFFFALALIICVAIIFDLSEKMDNFLDRGAPFKAIIFEYYLNFIPYFANMFSYLFVFIAVIFFTSRMAAKSEFIAMFSSGISLNRIMVPYFIAASIITIFSFVLSNYVIPSANKERLEFEKKYLRRHNSYNGAFNVHSQVYPGIYFFIENYNRSENIGMRMTLEKFEGVELKSKLYADVMTWDSTKNKWTLREYYIRNIDGNKEEIIRGAVIDTSFNMKPENFSQETKKVETMKGKELDEYIEEQRLSGSSEIIASELERNTRKAAPFSTFILTIIGFSLSIKKVRSGGLGLNIGIGLLLSFTYILFMKFSSVFALSGIFNVTLSVWMPNIIYALIAIGVYFTTPK